MSWAEKVERVVAKRNPYRIMMGNPEGKRAVGRSRHTRYDVVKMFVRDMGWSCMDSIDLAEDKDRRRAVVNTVINLRVSSNVVKVLSS
jgi:hypothetical protein